MTAAVPAEPTVWIDGELRSPGDQVVPALAGGLEHARGLFETVRLEGGQPLALRRHLARLARSAPRLGLRVPSAGELLAAVATVAATRAAEPVSRLKILLAAGGGGAPTLVVSARSAAPGPAALAVGLAPWVRNERSPVAGVKCTAYVENLLALDWAVTHGLDEALLADSRGRLSEGTMTNVFLSLDGERLLTPSPATGALPGILREQLLEWLPATGVQVEEVELPVADLAQVREMFVTNAVRGVVPVSSLDGRALPAPGPLTAAAARCHAERYAAERGLPPRVDLGPVV